MIGDNSGVAVPSAPLLKGLLGSYFFRRRVWSLAPRDVRIATMLEF